MQKKRSFKRINGLLPHLQQLASLQKHETLAEAFKAAYQAELAYQLTAAPTNWRGSKRKRNYSDNNNTRTNSHQSNKNNRDRRCTYCNMDNHLEKQCFKKVSRAKEQKRQRKKDTKIPMM